MLSLGAARQATWLGLVSQMLANWKTPHGKQGGWGVPGLVVVPSNCSDESVRETSRVSVRTSIIPDEAQPSADSARPHSHALTPTGPSTLHDTLQSAQEDSMLSSKAYAYFST